MHKNFIGCKMDIVYKPILPETSMPIIIIGASGIVKDAHLPAYQKAGFNVIGITNRTKEKAVALAEEFNIPNIYDSVADAVKNAPVNTIYDITILPDQFVETLQQ